MTSSHLCDRPVAVIDSGLGGLTVARALRSALPGEHLLYFGDTARLPYGGKSAETVTGFLRQILAYLTPMRPKHVVVACNTATALALPALRAAFPHLRLSGVIEPGARAAVEAAGAKARPVVAVLATEATVRSRAYERAIGSRRQHAKLVLRPAPLLVPLVEEGRDARDPLVRLAVTQYLKPLLARRPDVLVLGCTHYPIYRDLFTELAGPTCRVIDSAEQCAEDVARRLTSADLLRATLSPGRMRCFVTDDAPKFQRLAERFLGSRIDEPTLVSLGQLDEPPALRAVGRW